MYYSYAGSGMTDDADLSVQSNYTVDVLTSPPFKFLFKNCLCLFFARFLQIIMSNLSHSLKFVLYEGYGVATILSTEFFYQEFVVAIPSGFIIVMQYYYSYYYNTDDLDDIKKLRSDYMLITLFMLIISIILMFIFSFMDLSWLPCTTECAEQVRPLVCFYTGFGFIITMLTYLLQQLFFIENRFLLVFSIGFITGLGCLSLEALSATFVFRFFNTWPYVITSIIVYALVALWLFYIEHGKTPLGIKNKQQILSPSKISFRKKDGQFKHIVSLFLQCAACSCVYITGPVAMLVSMYNIEIYHDRMSDSVYRLYRNSLFSFFYTCQLYKIAPWLCQSIASKIIVTCDREKSQRRFVAIMIRALELGAGFNIFMFLLIAFGNASAQLFGNYKDFEGFFESPLNFKIQSYGFVCGILQCFYDIIIVMHLHRRKYATIVSMAISKYAFTLVMIKMTSKISHQNTSFYNPIIGMEVIGGLSSVPMFIYDIVVWFNSDKKSSKKNYKKTKK